MGGLRVAGSRPPPTERQDSLVRGVSTTLSTLPGRFYVSCCQTKAGSTRPRDKKKGQN